MAKGNSVELKTFKSYGLNQAQLRKMQLQGLRLRIEPTDPTATASVAQSVERWSRDPRFNFQPEALELHFSQLVSVGS